MLDSSSRVWLGREPLGLGCATMRIKAVLRDGDILATEAGSPKRVLATAMKNLDRVVSLGSLLKIMGLPPDGRGKMLEALVATGLHIWLAMDADQHVVYLSKNSKVSEPDFSGYMWQ